MLYFNTKFLFCQSECGETIYLCNPRGKSYNILRNFISNKIYDEFITSIVYHTWLHVYDENCFFFILLIRMWWKLNQIETEIFNIHLHSRQLQIYKFALFLSFTSGTGMKWTIGSYVSIRNIYYKFLYVLPMIFVKHIHYTWNKWTNNIFSCVLF